MGLFGGGNSTTNQETNNYSSAVTPTTNLNAAAGAAPNVVLTGVDASGGGHIDTTLNNFTYVTDLGAIDAGSKAVAGALGLAGNAITDLNAGNSTALKTLQQVNKDSLSAVGDAYSGALASQAATTSTLIHTVDSSFSRLGDSFSGALSFLGAQENQLQTATTSAISTVAEKNQSETALQTSQIQTTLIKLVGIAALAFVAYAFAKGR